MGSGCVFSGGHGTRKGATPAARRIARRTACLVFADAFGQGPGNGYGSHGGPVDEHHGKSAREGRRAVGLRAEYPEGEPIALGARGVYVGRAFLYGLGAMGEAGVTLALDILRKELDITMGFCGLRDIKKVDRGILVPGTYPGE